MTRVAYLVIVGCLALGASGVVDLVTPERCSPVESASADDGNCPATCVRCNCCAQPTDLILPAPGESLQFRVVVGSVVVHFVLPASSSEIFHVPRFIVL